MPDVVTVANLQITLPAPLVRKSSTRNPLGSMENVRPNQMTINDSSSYIGIESLLKSMWMCALRIFVSLKVAISTVKTASLVGHSTSSGPIFKIVPTRPSPILLKIYKDVHVCLKRDSVKF